MEKLGDIINSVMAGEKPDYDDLRYAVCAMSNLMKFDEMALSALAEAEREGKRKILSYSAVSQYEYRFNRLKEAYAQMPKDWLGPDNDLDSAEVQKRKKEHRKILKQALKNSSGKK